MQNNPLFGGIFVSYFNTSSIQTNQIIFFSFKNTTYNFASIVSLILLFEYSEFGSSSVAQILNVFPCLLYFELEEYAKA